VSVIDRRAFVAAGAAATLAPAATLPRPAIAQSAFPSKPLRLIVPAPAGSRHGLSARLFAESLARVAGQPVDVDHPDSTPATGYGVIAGAGTDGHTIGYATVDLAILHWRGLSDIKPADLTPIAVLNEDPAGVHVRADSPWKGLRELTAHIKANPGSLKASSTPAGGIWHLSTVGWLGAAGLPVDALPWVPAAGPAAGVEDMLLGASDIIVCSTPEVRITHHASKTRTLAIMARTRIARFGNIPTVQQALGTDHTAGAWRGLVVPKGVAAGTAAQLTALAQRAWEDKAFQSQMQRRGFLLTWAGGSEAGRYMQASSDKLGGALRTAGLVK
jgi:tripartite-type tricarboxylate transporter receptor subunit TctC